MRTYQVFNARTHHGHPNHAQGQETARSALQARWPSDPPRRAAWLDFLACYGSKEDVRGKRMKSRFFRCLVILLLVSPLAYAKGGISYSKSSGAVRSPGSIGPGTGSKSSSSHVSGYTKRDGTHVDSYQRSTPDKNSKNNWSTKGNVNPATGKAGKKIAPERK